MNKFNSSVSGLMINDENEQPYEKHPSNLDLPSDNESFNKNYLSHSKYFQTQDRTVINKKNKKSIVFPEIPTNN